MWAAVPSGIAAFLLSAREAAAGRRHLQQPHKQSGAPSGAPLASGRTFRYDELLREESTLVSELRELELFAIRVSRLEYFSVIIAS
jgi:hypothetical protein